MALVRKRVATLGEWTARNEAGRAANIRITPKRIDHWLQSGRDLIAAGVRIPVCYGHQFAAIPCDPAIDDPAAYANAAYRAGDAVGYEKDAAGNLDAILDLPQHRLEGDQLVTDAKLADGTRVKTVVRDVSPLLGLNWTDGKGRQWNDILGHVALTPYPVQAGQPGFRALSADPKRARGGFYLDGPPQADDEDDPTKPKKKPDPAAEVADDLLEPAPEDDDAAPLDQPAAGGEADRMSRILGNFAELGVPLPGDTTPENLLERLDVALGMLCSMKKAAPAAPAQPPAAKQPPQEAPAPTMLMDLTPREQKLLHAEADRRRADRAKRIAALTRRNLPVHVARELSARASGVRLALDPKSGTLRDGELDRALTLLERVLPGADDPRTLLSTATPLPDPTSETGGEELVRHPASGIEMPKSQLERIQAQARR